MTIWRNIRHGSLWGSILDTLMIIRCFYWQDCIFVPRSFWTAICNCKALSSSIKFSFVVEVIVPESLLDQIPVVYRLKNLLALYVLDACIYSKSGLQWNVPLNFLTLWICNYFQIIFSFINLGITGTLACCWLVLQSSRSYLN